MHGLLRIGVGQLLEHLADFNLNPKLLVQFASETLLEGFSGFTLAAGKFPEPAKVRVGMALSDEEFAGTEDQAGTDFNDTVSHLTVTLNRNPNLVPGD